MDGETKISILEKDRKNKIKNLNTVFFRTQKIKNSKKVEIDENKMISLDNDKIFYDKILQKVALLSKPDNSASGSVVYLLKTKDNLKQYIMKITGIKKIINLVTPILL